MVEISWNMMNHLGEEQWLITVIDILPAEHGDRAWIFPKNTQGFMGVTATIEDYRGFLRHFLLLKTDRMGT